MKTEGLVQCAARAGARHEAATRSRKPRRVPPVLSLATVVLLVLGCGDDDPLAVLTCPAPGDPPSIEQQICAIFPEGDSRDVALARAADVRRSAQGSPARLENVLELVAFVREQESALLDPDGPGPQTAVGAEADLLEGVVALAGITADVTPTTLTEGLATPVPREGGTFIAEDECFGLEFPPDWGGPAFLLLTPLPRDSDPLDDSLGQFVAQYPAYAEIELSAQPEMPVTVGIFTITNEIPPDRLPALRIAHNVPGGGVEIGPLVDLTFDLLCPAGAALSVGGPGLAGSGSNGIELARGRQTGTRLDSFSPFGTVDPGD